MAIIPFRATEPTLWRQPMAPVVRRDGPLDPSCPAFQPYRESLRHRRRRIAIDLPPSTTNTAPIARRIPGPLTSATIRWWRNAGFVVRLRAQPVAPDPGDIPPCFSGATRPSQRGAIPRKCPYFGCGVMRPRPIPTPPRGAGPPVSGPPDTGNGRVSTSMQVPSPNQPFVAKPGNGLNGETSATRDPADPGRDSTDGPRSSRVRYADIRSVTDDQGAATDPSNGVNRWAPRVDTSSDAVRGGPSGFPVLGQRLSRSGAPLVASSPGLWPATRGAWRPGRAHLGRAAGVGRGSRLRRCRHGRGFPVPPSWRPRRRGL